MRYKPNEVIAPFWAESSDYSTGRDPLGIQNSSIATYSTLLPGMTNAINRIRYYGFYSWVLKEYQKPSREIFNSETQHQFIRRSELLMAFIMHINFPEATGVSGTLYASQNYSEGETEVIDIDKGAKKRNKNKDSYWQYGTGAFGQYFLGSLINLNLIDVVGAQLYRLSERGLELADIFQSSIPTAEQELFLSIVSKGKFHHYEFNRLNSFSLIKDLNAQESTRNEWQYYIDLLLSSDGNLGPDMSPLYFRKETIKNFLKGRINQETHLSHNMYLIKGGIEEEEDTVKMGWYYYQLNEYSHISLEIILFAIIKALETHVRPVDLNQFLEELELKIKEDIRKEDLFTLGSSLEEVMDFLKTNDLGNSSKNVFNLLGKTKEATVSNLIYEAFKVLLSLYIDNEKYFRKLDLFSYKYKMKRNGAPQDLLKNIIGANLNNPLKTTLRKLLLWIINHHMSVAYQKMGRGTKNVAKLALEDFHISSIRQIDPTFTSPRLGTLEKFLIDLRLIDVNGITDEGQKILATL